jgi:hypothetical protein
VGTADTPVLRETDSWVGRELGGFDLTGGRFYQLVKLLTLLLGNDPRATEVVDAAFLSYFRLTT